MTTPDVAIGPPTTTVTLQSWRRRRVPGGVRRLLGTLLWRRRRGLRDRVQDVGHSISRSLRAIDRPTAIIIGVMLGILASTAWMLPTAGGS